MKYNLLALASISLISACAPRVITMDYSHDYQSVESISGEELDNQYLVRLEKKDSSQDILKSYIDTLNAVAKYRGESLSSICDKADKNRDNIIDASEMRSLLKSVGKFEVTH